MSIHSAKTLSANSPSATSLLGKLGQPTAAGKALDGELPAPVFAKMLNAWTPPPQRISPAPPPDSPTALNRASAPAPKARAEAAPKSPSPAINKERPAERNEAPKARLADAGKPKDVKEAKEVSSRKRPTGPEDDAAAQSTVAPQPSAVAAAPKDDDATRQGQATGQAADAANPLVDPDAHALPSAAMDPTLLAGQPDLAIAAQRASNGHKAGANRADLGQDPAATPLYQDSANPVIGRSNADRFGTGWTASSGRETAGPSDEPKAETTAADSSWVSAQASGANANPASKGAGADAAAMKALRAEQALAAATGQTQDLSANGKVDIDGWQRATAEALHAGSATLATKEVGQGLSFGSLLQAASALPGNASVPSPSMSQASMSGPTVSLPTHLMAPEFAPDMAARLSLLATEGVQRAELHLNPAEMGPVSVQIAVDGQQAQVHFHAHHEATREVLERSLPELAAALRDAGMTLSGGGVFQQARDGQASNSPGEGASTSERARSGEPGNTLTGSDSTLDSPPLARRPQRGVLDTYA